MKPILHHYWGSNYAEKARKILAALEQKNVEKVQ